MPDVGAWQLAGLAGAGLLLGAAGWTANGWRLEAVQAASALAASGAQARQSAQALETLRASSAAMRAAADAYRQSQSALAARLDRLEEELQRARPLPVDCRPDAERMRLLSGAVDATRAAAAAR
ncbi:hypothetical protein BKK81_23600 [Cupriavidus sp. USMAHM13]|uniref:hypothetical protein n=1 Tax=Cupriavidus sp. USMAHM13 TaxID=1389192 RepID=UPI0008A6C2C1|nr:hypothetical protein [Cupriavidus sp. USMAHM13]AOZ02271.1 hypothetical protein BKK81_23600 [Cupriavidus sp. USMAHM13]